MSDDLVKQALVDRIKEHDAAFTNLHREYDRRGDRIDELEAKLAQGIVSEYDDGSRVSLSAFAGGASEGGAWSHLTLMKEERDGAVSFRRYTADGDWCSPLVSSAPAELSSVSCANLKGQNDE